MSTKNMNILESGEAVPSVATKVKIDDLGEKSPNGVNRRAWNARHTYWTLIISGLILVVAAGAYFVCKDWMVTDVADINVRDYGIVADGVTDDTAKIQSAALSAATTGGVLYFPAGNYVFKNIEVPSNTTITFEKGSTVKAPSSENIRIKYPYTMGETPKVKDSFFRIEGKSGVTISGNGVILNGNYPENVGQTYYQTTYDAPSNVVEDGIFVKGSQNININNIVAKNFLPDPVDIGSNAYGMGINVLDSSSVNIANCTITNSRIGIYYDNVTNGNITNNNVSHSFWDGILIYNNSKYIEADNNLISDYGFGGDEGRAGLHAYGSTDIIFIGNELTNAYQKKDGDPASGQRLNGLATVVQDLTYDPEGIRFRNSERFWCENNTVDKNLNNSSIGVVLVEGNDKYYKAGLVGGDGTIINNTVTNGGLIGIGTANTHITKPVMIIGNTVQYISQRLSSLHQSLSATNTYAATGISVGSKDAKVFGNLVWGIDGSGITLMGTNELATGNKIYNVGRKKLGLSSGIVITGTGATVTNNFTQDYIVSDTSSADYHPNFTAEYGVYLYRNSSATVRSNTVQSSNNGLRDLKNLGTLLTATDILAPTLSNIVSFNRIDDSSASVTWNSSSDASGVIGYKIERANDNNGVAGDYSKIGSTSELADAYITVNDGSAAFWSAVKDEKYTFKDRAVKVATAYWYRVTSYDGKGNISVGTPFRKVANR